MKHSFSKTNSAVARNKGRVGEIRYYTKEGYTYSRTAYADVPNPRTDGQMKARVRVGNIVNTYRMAKNFFAKCFELADNRVTVYNRFFQWAVGCPPVYLTKELARSGAAVAAPYAFSAGKLPPIVYGLNTNGILQSNLSLGSLTIGPATTVGEFAEAIVKNNNKEIYHYGDFISFVEVLQEGTVEFPLISVKGDNVKLIENSPELLMEKVSTHGFATVGGCLGMDGEPAAGCYGWCHSREGESITVSGQFLYNCNEEMLSHFTGDEAFQLARDSYGKSAPKPFIVSDDGEGGEEPVPPVDAKTVSLSVPTAMQSMGDIQINDRTKAKSDTLAVAVGTEVTIKAIPVSNDYQFTSWSDGNTSTTRTLPVNEDISLSASFSPVE